MNVTVFPFLARLLWKIPYKNPTAFWLIRIMFDFIKLYPSAVSGGENKEVCEAWVNLNYPHPAPDGVSNVHFHLSDEGTCYLKHLLPFNVMNMQSYSCHNGYLGDVPREIGVGYTVPPDIKQLYIEFFRD
jgi:hypothetical protein